MAEDAKFEDGAEAALHLKAMDAEDVQVLSATLQDAVLPVSEIKWQRRTRQLFMLVNRFRWELPENMPPERVQALVAIEDVKSVASQGFDRKDADLVLSVLAISARQLDNADFEVELTLAGDGAIAVRTEALEITLRDVTRPYLAPSKRRPDHT